MFFFRKHPYFLRILSLTCLLSTLQATLAPTISWALTAGPTAPEFSSFEPVDTTDMVNLSTGDFTYSIPLLDVPGPEGGYPLALSYHAGIGPDEESSWVGLGWSLNAGAINRVVNMFADDHNNIHQNVRDYNPGGTSEFWSVGIGLPVISGGLIFGNDTYRGFGVGSYVGVGVGIGNSPLSVGANLSNHPYGGSTLSAGVGLKIQVGGAESKAKGLGMGMGIETNFESVSTYGRLGIGTLGISMGSNSDKPSWRMAGGSFDINNQSAGKMTTNTWGFTFPIPLGKSGVFLNLGYRYLRYYSNESASLRTYGALHGSSHPGTDNTAFDSYALPDPYIDNALFQKPDRELGGSLPAYDHYSVLAQGLGGQMQPYILENGCLGRQNEIEYEQYLPGQHIVSYYLKYNRTNKRLTKPVNFRFKNDFSNSLTRELPSVSITNTPNDGKNIFIGSDNIQLDLEGKGYSETESRLAGSKHITYFTNHEIMLGTAANAGFICPEATYVERAIEKYGKDVRDQIGGFMITNESGVTYHFGLPVYAYDEQTTYKKDDAYRYKENPQPYAYTWLLNAITGPDYVDRFPAAGLEGPDPADYGYWIRFEYGQWTDVFQWRNPHSGFQEDIEASVQYYSSGKKELYYLDAISSRTHTALFVKELRNDGKGVSDELTGGSSPVKKLLLEFENTPGYYTDMDEGDDYYYQFPVSTLRLNEILLFKTDELKKALLTETGSGELSAVRNSVNYTDSYTYSARYWKCDYLTEACEPLTHSRTVTPHYYNNLIDETDRSLVNAISRHSLRSIEFSYDYSLCDKVPNSINRDIYTREPNESPAFSGKLGLQQIRFLGKGKESVLPPVTFEYNSPNPDYHPKKKDMWGNYQHHYNENTAIHNRNLEKYGSESNGQYAHAWCLTDIKTALGANIKIDYEPDVYNSVALTRQMVLRAKNISYLGGNEIEIDLADTWADLNELCSVGDMLEIDVLAGNWYNGANRKYYDRSSNLECSIYSGAMGALSVLENSLYEIHERSGASLILSVDNTAKKITISDADLVNSLMQERYYRTDLTGPYGISCYSAGLHSDADGEYSFFRKWPDVIVAGSVTSSNSINRYGGGVRVAAISVESDEYRHTTRYTYHNGTTSYEPFAIMDPYFTDHFNTTVTSHPNEEVIRGRYNRYFKNIVYKRCNELIILSNEIPAPGVMYEKVEIKEYAKDKLANLEYEIPGRKEYFFTVFKDATSNSDNKAEFERNYEDSEQNGVNIRKITFRDFTNRVGNLKKVVTYDVEGEKLHEAINEYLHDEEQTNQDVTQKAGQKFASQGRIDQLFHESRTIKDRGHQLLITKKEEHPCIMTGSYQKNYKTGMEEQVETIAFDYYNGKPLTTMSSDGMGNVFLAETEYAYRNYDGMGLKTGDAHRRHMLTQVTRESLFKLDNSVDQNRTGLLSSSIQSWSNSVPVQGVGNQSLIWRKHAGYVWASDELLQSDGTLPLTNFGTADGFNFSTNTPYLTNSRWQKVNETTLYDAFSNPLEWSDINGNFGAILMNRDHSLVTAAIVNSPVSLCTASGAEYFAGNNELDNGVSRMDGSVSSYIAHTGMYSLMVPPGKEGFSFTIPGSAIAAGKKFAASVWMYLPNSAEADRALAGLYYQYEGSTEKISFNPELSYKAGSWYLVSIPKIEPELKTGQSMYKDIRVGCSNNHLKESIYLDDFRVHPLDAVITAYVYDQATLELVAILNNDNIYTRYVYDEAGRLRKIAAEKIGASVEVPVMEKKYNYAQK